MKNIILMTCSLFLILPTISSAGSNPCENYSGTNACPHVAPSDSCDATNEEACTNKFILSTGKYPGVAPSVCEWDNTSSTCGLGGCCK